jgi:hypothetical protein
MNIAHGEMVETELNRLIARPSRQEIDPEERDELWKASVAAYNARRREENRREWCGYFTHLAGALRARAEEYDRRAALLTNAEEKTS